MPFVSSEVEVGTTPHVVCEQPTATWSFPTFITNSLAAAVRVQEDGGKNMGRTGWSDGTSQLADKPQWVKLSEKATNIQTFPLCCFDQISCWLPKDTS